MHDADSRRNELESLESLLPPLEKLVTLAITLELHVQIEFQRARRTEEIDLHRVINNQIDRHERFDDLRVASESLHSAAHRCEVEISGTPVKSCKTMRATRNGISSFAGDFAFQLASVSTSLRRTFLSSQLRNTDSRTIRMLTGNREILPMLCSSSAGSEQKNPSRPLPASKFLSALNSSFILVYTSR